MRKTTVNIFTIMLAASLLAGCVIAQPAPPPLAALPTQRPVEDAQTITVGVISSDPAIAYDEYQPLADYLSEKLRLYNISSAKIQVFPDIDTTAEWLEKGDIDIVFDGLYATMRLRDLGDARAILRQLRNNEADFSSVIFASKASGISSLDGLKGKILALESPTSTAGYLLPLGLLIESGYKVRQVENLRASVPADTIGYYFSGADENTTQLVLTGKAPAGAINSLLFYNGIPELAKNSFNAIIESEKITQQVVVVSPALDSQMASTIASILRSMENEEQGKIILAGLNNTSRFEDIDPNSIFDRARHYFNQILIGK